MLEISDCTTSWIAREQPGADLFFDVATDAVGSSETVRITLATTLHLAVEERRMETHQVVVARLRADLRAAISLRNALNKAIVLAEWSNDSPEIAHDGDEGWILAGS